MSSGPAAEIAAAFKEHERFLFGLLYRMTGSAADADDLVQETFARALERPPPRPDLPWRPWLVRVALNLGRDLLRRRRRRGAYTGPWLPGPIETGAGGEPPSFDPPAPEGGGASAFANPAARYDLLESVSFAFLLALEALTPRQRAVLLLRDVLDYSVRETAEALALSEAAVKTTHHRARHAMEAYERGRRPLGALAAPTARALERLVEGLLTGDAAGLESLLAADVRSLSDGGGEYVAALNPIEGRDKVLRFLLGLARKDAETGGSRVEIRTLNGLPALVIERAAPPADPRQAPRLVLRCELDPASGAIRALHAVLAPRKLAAVGRS